jgi:hypothetical protein
MVCTRSNGVKSASVDPDSVAAVARTASDDSAAGTSVAARVSTRPSTASVSA